MAQSYRESSGGNIYLSKSLFIRGLQCHKSLYLQKYRPELKDEVSEETQRRFDIGNDAGSLAQQLFPGGVIVPYEGLSHSEQLSMTQTLIEQGIDTVYEAAFSHNGVFVKADILHRGNSGWEIYEVKSSASMKDYHMDDASVQYYVISGTGLPVTKVSLVHINPEYVRHGEIEVNKLFNIVDITEPVMEKESFIAEELQKQRRMLQGDEPVIDIGPHCDDPFACDFHGNCWSHISSPSVFDYREIGKPDGFALYRQGIVKMEDVSPDILGWRQKMQLDGVLHQKNHIDADAVRSFIKTLWYPLCFMDFETTFMVPIPMYDGTWPFQQVPFQYSVHVIHESGGELEHHEFLADGASNPQKEFLERLLAIVPRNACTLVWNQSFEITRLKELADAFPEKSSEIANLINNIRDLIIPFRDKSIYHWQFNGSYSIKAVLPALVPELSYDNLDISDGGMASSEWVRMIQSTDEEEKSAGRKQLLQYCHLDTFAMVRILEIMKEMVAI
ncbi:MAG: DUF2779 domain-containing protein [Syntrophaceae bacterium]|nr:DUF2779 domain-containing protein [Syntrophaceae bacterium]